MDLTFLRWCETGISVHPNGVRGRSQFDLYVASAGSSRGGGGGALASLGLAGTGDWRSDIET